MGNSLCIVDDAVIGLPCFAFWFLVIGLPILVIAGFCCCCCFCGRSDSNPPNLQLPSPVSPSNRHRASPDYVRVPVVFQSDPKEKRACHECQASLVESANFEANEGKNIADNMIKGYEDLASKISQTKEIINSVTIFSKEQEIGIIQINDTI